MSVMPTGKLLVNVIESGVEYHLCTMKQLEKIDILMLRNKTE
jgi:hypothetical protein